MRLERNATNEEISCSFEKIYDDFEEFFWKHSRTSETLLKCCWWRVFMKEKDIFSVTQQSLFFLEDSFEETLKEKKNGAISIFFPSKFP